MCPACRLKRTMISFISADRARQMQRPETERKSREKPPNEIYKWNSRFQPFSNSIIDDKGEVGTYNENRMQLN